MNRYKRIALTLGWFSLPLLYYWVKDMLYLPACSIKATFDIPCPGCGMRRGLDAAYHLDFSEMISVYPPLVPFLILYVFIGLNILFKNHRYLFRERQYLIIFFLVLITVLVHWLYELIT
jgi:Protein of unknown function (DUF2752)